MLPSSLLHTTLEKYLFYILLQHIGGKMVLHQYLTGAGNVYFSQIHNTVYNKIII